MDTNADRAMVNANEDIPTISTQRNVQIELSDNLPSTFSESQTNSLETTTRHWLVLPVCFLYMSAYTMTLTTFPQYVYLKMQEDTFPTVPVYSGLGTSICEVKNTSALIYLLHEDIEGLSAKWEISYYLAGGITAIASNFVLGSFTDRFGRKYLFFVSSVGTFLRIIAQNIGVRFNLPFNYYTAFYVLEGLTGQAFSLMQIGYIYASDITKIGTHRPLGIMAIQVAFGLGASLSPATVSYLLKPTKAFILKPTTTKSFVMPFYISEGLLVLAIILIFFLPETNTKDIRSQREYTSKFDNLKDSANIFFSKKNKGRRWLYWSLLTVFILTAFGLYGQVGAETQFFPKAPICWNPDKVGAFNAMQGVIQQIIGLSMVIVLHIYLSSETVVILGCISFSISFLMEAFAAADIVMYLAATVGAIRLVTMPVLRSIMSQMTSPDKQGAVFAAISTAETTMSVIGTMGAVFIYLGTVDSIRGFVFLLFSLLNFIGMVLMIFFVVVTKKSPRKYERQDMDV